MSTTKLKEKKAVWLKPDFVAVWLKLGVWSPVVLWQAKEQKVGNQKGKQKTNSTFLRCQVENQKSK